MPKLSSRNRSRPIQVPAIVESLEGRIVLTLAVLPLMPIKGVEFNGVVATLAKNDIPGAVAEAKATIDWGRGVTTDNEIRVNPTDKEQLQVIGKFTYGDAGPFPVRVVVTSGQTTLSALGTANVQYPPIALWPVSAIAYVGQPATDLEIGRFRVEGTEVAPGDFTASVKFGESTTPIPAKVIGVTGSPGDFLVRVDAVFPAAGTVKAKVDVQWKGGASAISTESTITVLAQPMFLLQGTSVAVVAGAEPLPRVLASITDVTPGAKAEDYWAEVELGAGVLVPGAVRATNQAGVFEVVASVAYANPGSFSPTVWVRRLSDEARGITSAQVLATAQSSITLSPISAVAYAGQITKDLAIGRFYASEGGATPGQFAASVKFGESTTPVLAKVVRADDALGGFLVLVDYTFPAAGAIKAKVDVQWASGGAGATADSTIQVVAQPMFLQGIPSSIVAGTEPSPQVLARLTDLTPGASAGGYWAEVKLENGVLISGTIRATNQAGVFEVVASVAYDRPGNYAPIVTVRRLADGTAANATAQVLAVAVQPFVPGRLDPSTDTGTKGDGKTSSTNPRISGVAVPRSVIVLTIRRPGQAVGRNLAQTVADPSGRWSIKIGPLARGTYYITQTTLAPTLDPEAQEIFRPGAPLIITPPERFRRRA